MTQWLKQNTATDRKIGPFIDDTDGKTAETGLTTAYTLIYLSKNGGALTAKSETTAIAHDALGYYLCKLNATDTNTLGSLKLATHVAGHLPVWQEFMVVPANVWDSFFGASLLVVDAAAVKTDTAALVKGRYNRNDTDPVTGDETVYEDDSATVFRSGPIFEDIAGTMPFDGTGANRRDRMT